MSTQDVRDLVWVCEQEVQRLVKRANEILTTWKAHWFPSGSGWTPTVSASHTNDGALDAPTTEWRAHANNEATTWHHQEEDTAAQVAQWMLHRKGGARLSSDDWACQAAQAALTDLHTRMLGAPKDGAGSPPEFGPYGGTLRLSEGSIGCSWVWQWPVAQNQSTKPTSITPLAQCLPQGRITVEASLGHIDILMSDLLALQSGDVVPFPTSTDGSIAVQLSTDGTPGPSAFTARIGHQQGHWALQASGLAPSSVKK